MNTHTFTRGFTLPEILVSLSLIIILTTILLPSLAGARQRAARAAAIKTMTTLRDKSEVLIMPTVTTGVYDRDNSKIYQSDLCSFGFVSDLQSINKRLGYSAYVAVNSTAANVELSSSALSAILNTTKCHERSDGTAWVVLSDTNPNTLEKELFCTDYTGFAGIIQENYQLEDWQCDADANTLQYGTGTGYGQGGLGSVACDPTKTKCIKIIPTTCKNPDPITGLCPPCPKYDDPTTDWRENDCDCDKDGIPNDLDQCDTCDADGKLGDVCGVNTLFNWYVRSFDIQGGNFIVGGTFSQYGTGVNNKVVWKIARIKPDGSLDTTFGSAAAGSNKGLKSTGEQHNNNPGTDAEPAFVRGGVAGSAGIKSLSSGNIMVLGAGSDAGNTEYDANSHNGKGLFITNVNGILNTTFMNNVGVGLQCEASVLGSGPCGTMSSVEVGSEIWIAGRFNKWSNKDVQAGIVKLQSNGTVLDQNNQISSDDLVWNNNNWVNLIKTGTSIYATTDSTDIYYGSDYQFTTGNFQVKDSVNPSNTRDSVIARFTSAGVFDKNFKIPYDTFTYQTTPSIQRKFSQLYSVVEIGNYVYITGDFRVGNYENIARFNRSSGSAVLDTTFAGGSLKISGSDAANGTQGMYLLKLSTGKLLVYGDISTFNGVAVNDMVRINQDGTKDNSFDVGSGITSTIKYRPGEYGSVGTVETGIQMVRAVYENPDKTLIIMGEFSEWGGKKRGYMATLNNNGALSE